MNPYTRWIRIAVIVISSVIFLFSVTQIVSYAWDGLRSKEQMAEARRVYEKPELQVANSVEDDSPTEEAGNKPAFYYDYQIQPQFLPLLELNEDVAGWVQIEGTAINYPVLQAEDNEYYLTRGLDQSENKNGSVFMDYRNEISTKEKHMILYGHNMKNKTMFADLLNYESQWYLEQHPEIQFETIYYSGTWEIFSAYFTDTSDPYLETEFAGTSEEEFASFVTYLKNKSMHNTAVTVEADDTILTLSTCSAEPGEQRFVVHAKFIPL